MKWSWLKNMQPYLYILLTVYTWRSPLYLEMLTVIKGERDSEKKKRLKEQCNFIEDWLIIFSLTAEGCNTAKRWRPCSESYKIKPKEASTKSILRRATRRARIQLNKTSKRSQAIWADCIGLTRAKDIISFRTWRLYKTFGANFGN